VKTNKYKRQIAVADIHGMYALLKNLVEGSIRFNPDEDQLVFLGDYIDRGTQSREVVEYVISLKARYPGRIILLKGNHEDLAERALSFPTWNMEQIYFGSTMGQWLINGGQATINSYGDMEGCREGLLPFIGQLQLYYETPTHIFVHGGIPNGKTLKTATPHELIWNRGADHDGLNKTLVVGHCIHETAVVERDFIAIDTGAYLTGKLSAYDVINGRLYEAAGRPAQ
jgi:serine/threonine protein phosphatase 1